MRIATWNVNSVKQRVPRLLPWLDARRPDVVCLQETKCPDDAFNDLLGEELDKRGYAVALHGEATWNGVAILSRVGLDDVVSGLPGEPGFPNPEARAVSATCDGVRVYSVYVPNGRAPGSEHYEYKLAWLAALRDALTQGPEAKVVCGDMNIAPTDEDVFNPEAYVGHTHVTEPERAALAELQALGLHDVVRERWPDERVFSYWDYRADGGWTLHDVDLVVPAGTRTAVVGETGAGKTTLGYLVARLYEPQQGRVTIDAVDVREASLRSLAATVGVVSQETYLFHASVRENLRFAKPEASDEEIEAAASTARIHELIASLPEGYDTVVGERGYRFSGGEKQRMAIARTILRNPPVLVLDEATSSLDTQTEAAVQAELERLSQGRTTITIAHRLSTVRDADQIVVLDRGEIVERGTHEELLERAGAYSALVARDVPEEEPLRP